MIMIQSKDNDILSLLDKHLSVFYHEATGLQYSIKKEKHWNVHIIHIRSRDEEVRKKFRIINRQWSTTVPMS